jgi:hypothetical protein
MKKNKVKTIMLDLTGCKSQAEQSNIMDAFLNGRVGVIHKKKPLYLFKLGKGWVREAEKTDEKGGNIF